MPALDGGSDAGNEAPDVRAPPACHAILGEFRAFAGNQALDGGRCEASADCEIITPRLTCENGSVVDEVCPVGISTTDGTYAATLDNIRGRICPLLCGMQSTPACLVTPSVDCVSARCVTKY